jgi:16S rRNA (cytosine1402-N4)-methyltransferase
LLDLGVSSPQLDQAERGFSFLRDGPLDMRMDSNQVLTAATWLASAKEADIVWTLVHYGEERFAKRIARALVKARAQAPITTTGQLAEIVAKANPRWERDKHPATRSFQALRILVNDEMRALEQMLSQVLEVLHAGGRLVVISFHSLEDRIVKRFMRDNARGDYYPAKLAVTVAQLQPKLRCIGKAIRADSEEIKQNPRARSAVLRVAEKLA